MMANPSDFGIDPKLWGGAAADARVDHGLDWVEPAETGDAAEEPVAPNIVTAEPAKPVPPPNPTAKAATPQTRGGKFRLKLTPEVEQEEELITPEKVKSWTSSLVFHLLLFFILWFGILSAGDRDPKTIEAGLPAGDPHGSDLGKSLTGGEGMDEPLAMPFLEADKTVVDASKLTATDLSTLKAASSALSNPLQGSVSGGGVALTGNGRAGSGDGFGVAKFGLGGTETVNNVSVKVGNPQFTLIWDTNVDLDLHVLEPGGSHISFEYRNGRRGGELDVDDVDGLGPENIYWGGGLNKGNGPPGEYKWYVHYYGGAVSEFGRQVLATPTRWRVRLKHNGTYKVFEGKLNAAGQQSKVYTFTIDKAEGSDEEGNAAAPARGGDTNNFNNPPSQVGMGQREVNVGSFNAPAERMPNERGRRERDATKKSQTKDASAAETPETKKAEAPPVNEPPARPAGSPRDESNWVIVKPEGVGFEVHMPDDPIEERRTGEADDAPEVKTWSLNRIEGGFTVAVTDIPVDRAKGDPKDLIDAEARREINEVSGTNMNMSATTVDGHPAADVEVDLPDKVVAGGGKAKLQLILVGRRLYRISAIGTKEFLTHADTRKFLASFKVTGPVR